MGQPIAATVDANRLRNLAIATVDCLRADVLPASCDLATTYATLGARWKARKAQTWHSRSQSSAQLRQEAGLASPSRRSTSNHPRIGARLSQSE